MAAKREKRSAKILDPDEEEKKEAIVHSDNDDDDDDEEANEDLSLKIVQKSSQLRVVKSSEIENNFVEETGVLRVELGDSKKKKISKTKKKKTKKKPLVDNQPVAAGVSNGDERKEEIAQSADRDFNFVEKENEDLNLNIVESSLELQHAAMDIKTAQSQIEKGLNGNNDTGVVNGEPTDVSNSNKKKKVKKVKNKTPPIDKSMVVEAVEEEEKKEEDIAAEIVQSIDTVQSSNNLVMRKLLRGPRYFDPPDTGGWESCFNCGEEGHMAVNCAFAKRKKPCFVCGSLEHGIRECQKAQDCYICKKGGHRAKDCPEKYKSFSRSDKICFNCLGSGHDMFSCHHDYSSDDLKEIQCYICKSFGHLCCANFVDTNPRQPSCYRCGQLGHTGLACNRLRMEDTGFTSPSSCYKCGEGGHFARECKSSAKPKRPHGETHEINAKKLRGETPYTESPSSCFKCGEEGHWARECSSSAKVDKRSYELSSPAKKSYKENKSHSGSKSAPYDHGKRKNSHHEDEGYTTPRRGGWIMDDPGDFSDRKSRHDHGYRKHHDNYSASSHVSSHTGSSNHRYSASRFDSGSRYGNSYGDDKRNNNWW